MSTGKLSWGSFTSTTISGTTTKSTAISTALVNLASTGYPGAEFQVGCDFPAGPTDALDFEFYGSSDGSTKDTTPFYAQSLDNGTDPNRLTVDVFRRPYISVHVLMDGGTDSGVTDVTWRGWTWDIS